MTIAILGPSSALGTSYDQLVPGPRGNYPLHSLPELRRKGQLRFFLDIWHKYGDVAHVQIGPIKQYFFADPVHIRHVLATNSKNYCKGVGFKKLKLAIGEGLFVSDGKLWQKQRTLLQPPFTAKSVATFASVMTNAAVRLTENWDKRSNPAKPLEINEEMMRLAMEIIAESMFSVSVGKEASDAARAFRYVLEFMSERSVTIFDIPLFVPIPSNRKFNEAMRILRDYMGRVIEQRRRQSNRPRDLLTRLIEATDPETGTGMSDKQLFDEVVTIFFAGHETTAQALTWTWYLLSRHPEVAKKMHQELQTVLGGRTPTMEDVPNLQYTRMVFEESMRLYPPVWIFVRDAIGPDRIGDTHVPAGSMVVLSQYITHRHPKHWPNPEAFDPERFSPERADERLNYAYFPFGGGPRTCLGDKFAMLEGILVLATIAQRYTLHLLPGHPVEPVAIGTLRPRYGMPMTLHRR
jgi:cytochrome P450